MTEGGRIAPPEQHARAIRARLSALWSFVHYAAARFVADGCLTGAGALSYTTLVSLVPLTAIALAVLSAFPIFADIRDQVLTELFQSFVPQVGAEVEWWFRYFAGASVRTTTIGVLALAVTAVLQLATIEDQLHNIWRVKSPRPWVQRILAYWAVLTLGPLLLGASFSLPGYVDLFVRRTGLNASVLLDEPFARNLVHVLPFLLETVAFTLIYELIPNCSVRWREAMVGGVLAATLIEILKIGFAFYVAYLSTYRAIYGALAAIPIFLLWMYISWAAVLFGAVVAAALPQWRTDEHATGAVPSARRLGLGLALLAELARQSRHGGTIPTTLLAERLGVATTSVDDSLTLLQKADFVAAAADGGWVLARTLDGATLIDLYRALLLPLAGSLRQGTDEPWRERVRPALERVAAAEADALSLPLDELVGIVGRPTTADTTSRAHRLRRQ